MPSEFAPSTHDKLALVWASRRERLVAVRVYYEVIESAGCTIYQIDRMEESDFRLNL